MLKDRNPKVIESNYLDKDKGELALELAALQRECIQANVPVMIIVDGFESSGKGYVINELVKELDTKYYRVNVFDRSDISDNYSYSKKVWGNLAPYGNFRILYRSMYTMLFNDLKSKDKEKDIRIHNIANFEKLLYDDNFIILKFFLDIDEKLLKENVKKLENDKFKNFFITKEDTNQVENYKDYRDNMDKVLDKTNFVYAKWNIISAIDNKDTAKTVLGISIDTIKEELSRIAKSRKEAEKFKSPEIKAKNSIKDLDLSKSLSTEEYKMQIEDLQERVSELAYKLYTEKIPSVIVFEGIDAAGKGGAIARLLRKIDPRMYSVNPTSAPSDLEKKHHYLWRFYNNLPKAGNMAVFDRSWYGRLMVERVEGFANDYEWYRAFYEINNMEKELVDNGVLLAKYHLVISKEEQEARFKDREDEKPYKITDEDWRNREKWDNYIVAMDEMIEKTSTSYAPWLVVASENKRYARVEVLKDFIKKAEERLKIK